MSTNEAEIIDDLDAKATDAIGAAYTAQRSTFMSKLWAVIAYGIAQYDNGAGGWTHRGDWNPLTEYVIGDVVANDGSSYVAIADNVGAEPPSGSWELVASKGDTGGAGSEGPAGPSNVITEASGPTDLAVGAVPDETVIARSGNTAVGRGAPRVGYVLADAYPTLATGIERYRGFLRLAEQPTFLGSSANDLTSTSPGWTYVNSAKLTTATRNAGTLTWEHAASASSAASDTAPMRYRTYRLMQGVQRWIVRVKHDCNANFEFAGLRARLDSVNTAVGIAIGYNGGNYFVGGTGASDVNIGSTAVVTNGVWLMLEIGNEGTWRTYYSTSTSTSPPTTSSSWVFFATSSGFPANNALVRVGMYADNGNQGGANTIYWLYWTDAYAQGEGGPIAVPAGGGSGFDTSGAAQTVVASFDLGRSAATVTDADVRNALQQVENQLDRDTATITWSVTRDGAANPAAATTYQSAATVNVKAAGSDTGTSTGRYLAVRCKITSDGTQRGSVNLMDLRIPYSA